MNHSSPNRHLLDLGRLVALIDGVYAVAMTLLVLDLKLPSESNDLVRALRAMTAGFLVYLIVFASIAGYSATAKCCQDHVARRHRLGICHPTCLPERILGLCNLDHVCTPSGVVGMQKISIGHKDNNIKGVLDLTNAILSDRYMNEIRRLPGNY
jgi:hypothetical protein